MSRKRLPVWIFSANLAVLLACAAKAAPQQEGQANAHYDDNVEKGIMDTMVPGNMHHGPHMKMTELRPRREGDDARAQEILEQLRDTLEKFEDHEIARRDGYVPVLPGLEQQEYHFTNRRRTRAANREFDPSAPSSLLYERDGNEWKLVGAMFTAARNASEAELDARVPLSYAQWHAHVNICIPPLRMLGNVDWSRYGPQGKIATREDCRDAGGSFIPQAFGWMVHIYPFEKTPDKIWGH